MSGMYANEAQFAEPSAYRMASKGIFTPKRRELPSGLLLFRYGTDLENATRGGWWLDLAQRNRIVAWATLHRIELPHAVRLMCAVMHEWQQEKPSDPIWKSTMEYLARAVSTRPLVAFEGATRPQNKDLGLRGAASIAAPALDPPMTQLYIPGLDDNMFCRDVLSYEAIVQVAPGASALFGRDEAILAVH